VNPESFSRSVLLVCWKKPRALPEAGGVLLSFLPPSDEEALLRQFIGTLVRAREASREIRAEAGRWYVDCVARLGACQDEAGQTLRQALASAGQASTWWYHPVSFRDSEGDPTFNWILAVHAIEAVADRHGIHRLVLVGAPGEVAAALRSRFHVIVDGRNRERRRPVWVQGLGSRALYLFRSLRHWLAIRRRVPCPAGPLDVVLSGFWDWSVWKEPGSQSLSDRYFRLLPEQLQRRGVRAVGWFAWFDPLTEPGKRHRRVEEILAPLANRHDVILIQRFLHPLEIIKAVLDFSAARTFRRFTKTAAFRSLFVQRSIDYYPLFARQLRLGFLNAHLPHHSLVALATERACRRYRPKVTVSFLEHFLYARAHYEGVRRAGDGCARLAVQHCSWSHEKTFLFLHPLLEFKGEPDRCAVPHPDTVFAMGTLAQELFLECGYEKDQVLLTGSPRYDHVRLAAPSWEGESRTRSSAGARVLIIASLDVGVEIDMVEAACAATQGLDNVHLSLRNHPFSRVDQHPRFDSCRSRIEVTQRSLQEDLEQADVILFTYSTVAEEALLQGKPVWQWLPMHFNGSALSEAVPIPRFGSVVELRQAIVDFQADRTKFAPRQEIQQLALTRLFWPGDGGAAERIARECAGYLQAAPRSMIGHG